MKKGHTAITTFPIVQQIVDGVHRCGQCTEPLTESVSVLNGFVTIEVAGGGTWSFSGIGNFHRLKLFVCKRCSVVIYGEKKST